MELLYIVIGVLIIFLAKSIYDTKNNRRLLILKLKNNWGKPPTKNYTVEQLYSIGFYYRTKRNKDLDVDDITWDDLDFEEIYLLINNTASSVGEEYLFSILKRLSFDEEVLRERNTLIEFFQKNPEKAIELQIILSYLGKLHNISVYEYINFFYNVRKDSTISHLAMAFGLLFSIILVFIQPAIGGILTFIMISNNVLQYYKRKGEINSYITVSSYIIRMLDSVKELSKVNIPEIKAYTDELNAIYKNFVSFKRGSRYVAAATPNGDIGDLILDYIRILFHIDLIKFNGMLDSIHKNKDNLNRMFEIIGLLDSMIAVASFRTMMPYYSLPKLEHRREPFIHAEEIYHPLINEPIPNSIQENRCVLITGSNASGKSTFLKSVAINGILSQTIFTSLSKHYEASYFQIASSMALRDDIFSKESYYIVEIKSLKRILDKEKVEIPTLCFVDEVLRGTNTLERIAASSQILLSFAKRNYMCFAATHDIELTYILENYYKNYHFKEEILDNDIHFDYRIHNGRAVSKNAIKLLSIMGYSDDIINKANDLCNAFLKDGNWDTIK